MKGENSIPRYPTRPPAPQPPSTGKDETVYLKRSPRSKEDEKRGSHLGVASIVLGICGIAVFWLPWTNLIFPATSIAVGAVGLHRVRGAAGGSRLPAAAGIVLGGVLFLIGLFVIDVAQGLSEVLGPAAATSATATKETH